MKKVTFETKITRDEHSYFQDSNCYYRVGGGNFCPSGWHRLTKFKLEPGTSQRVRITITPIKSAKKKKVT